MTNPMDLLQGPRIAPRWSAFRQRWGAAVLIVAAAVVSFLPVLLADPGQRLLWRAADALIRGQNGEAERLAGTVLEQRPGCAVALLIAGEATAKSARVDMALDYLLRVLGNRTA